MQRAKEKGPSWSVIFLELKPIQREALEANGLVIGPAYSDDPRGLSTPKEQGRE